MSRRVSSSMASVTSGRAGALVAVLNLSPLYCGGLNEAVKLMPPWQWRLMIWQARAWEGASRSASSTRIPLRAMSLAASRA